MPFSILFFLRWYCARHSGGSQVTGIFTDVMSNVGHGRRKLDSCLSLEDSACLQTSQILNLVPRFDKSKLSTESNIFPSVCSPLIVTLSERNTLKMSSKVGPRCCQYKDLQIIFWWYLVVRKYHLSTYELFDTPPKTQRVCLTFFVMGSCQIKRKLWT